MQRKTTVTTLVAATAVVASVLLVGPAASAAPEHCANGAGCAYQNTGFRGGYKGFQNSIPDFGKLFWSGAFAGMNESASSLYNNGNLKTVTWYKNPNKGGLSTRMGIKKYDSNLHDGVGVPAGFQDSISSSYFDK